MNNPSFDKMQELKESMSNMLDSFEDMYWKMRKELMDEIIEDRKTHYTKKNEMSDLFDKLSESNSMKMRWIKNKLPWYITMFHKISSYEMSLRDTSIFIGVCIGNSNESNCYIEITPRDIG